MPVLLIFTLFALLDFVILFSVGSQIGLLSTLLLVLATGVIGLQLIRREGTATLARARDRLARGELPSGELLTGAALIFGGALLLAPGFLSDAVGFLCLIPNARRLLGKLLAWLGLHTRGVHFRTASFSAGDSGGAWQHTTREGQERSGHGRTTDTRQGSQEAPLEGDFIAADERRG